MYPSKTHLGGLIFSPDIDVYLVPGHLSTGMGRINRLHVYICDCTRYLLEASHPHGRGWARDAIMYIIQITILKYNACDVL